MKTAIWPSLEAQSDEHPTGDQEVAGPNSAGSGNVLSWKLIMKYFLQSFPPSAGSIKAVCQFLA